MMGAFAADEAATVINGKPTIDPSRRFFYGNSMGGIYGLNYMAMSTDVTRGCVGVPGVRTLAGASTGCLTTAEADARIAQTDPVHFRHARAPTASCWPGRGRSSRSTGF